MTTDEPAVRTWQDATEAHMAAAAAAQVRRLTDELDQLRRAYNAVLLALGEMGKDLAAALIANDLLTRENERLRAATEEKP
jgi:hypothetical protein